MNMSNVEKEILDFATTALATLLKSDAAELTLDASPKNTNGWDSLAQVNLILAMEKEHGISFTIEQILEFESLADIVKTTVTLVGDRSG